MVCIPTNRTQVLKLVKIYILKLPSPKPVYYYFPSTSPKASRASKM